MKIVDSSSNSSACTTTPGLGRPSSLGTTTRTTSPRLTSSRSNRKPSHSTRRWHRFPDGAPSVLPVGANQLEPLDRANPAPNAGPAAGPARAAARGERPCAAGRCGVLTFSGSWPWVERNMLRGKSTVQANLRYAIAHRRIARGGCASRIPERRRQQSQLSTLSAAIKASCGMSTLPNCRIFFLPSFCFSRSFRLRVMSPP
jgi:hypothetical protein